MDPATGLSRGFAFLSFHDPKVANLAIQTMSGQTLAGRALRTGWANLNTVTPGLEEITSQEFPDDSAQRLKNVNKALIMLNRTGLAPLPGVLLVLGANAVSILEEENTQPATNPPPVPATSQITNVAEQAINAALGLPGPTVQSSIPATSSIISGVSVSTTPAAPPSPSKVIGAENPTTTILVRNMFDKDQETEVGWEEDIKLEFEEEAGKHGKLLSVKVMSQEVGGKIYASFDTINGAKACAEDLAGRWFDKRQLVAEFVSDGVIP